MRTCVHAHRKANIACGRSASVVRLGVLEATSADVQALHIDTLSGCRADEEQSAVSASGMLLCQQKSWDIAAILLP